MKGVWPYLLVLLVCVVICPAILITLPLVIGFMAMLER